MFLAFQPWHLKLFDLDEKLRALLDLERLAMAGHAFTVVADDDESTEVLGVVGAVPRPDRKSVEVFLITDEKHRESNPLTLARAVRTVLAKAREEYSVVEAIGDGSPRISRWLSWLGFKPVDGKLWRLA